MSVKVCPECGSEYVSAVAECADCAVELVVSDTDEMEAEIAEEAAKAADIERAELDGEETDGQPTGDQIAYEFAEWDNASRVLLDQLLTGQEIMHVWEATSLVVRAADEAAVDELVEQVEVTNQPTLDPDREQVVYDLSGWPDEKRSALTTSLTEAEIPLGFDENDDLVVHEDDEERVEALLDQVDFNFSSMRTTSPPTSSPPTTATRRTGSPPRTPCPSSSCPPTGSCTIRRTTRGCSAWPMRPAWWRA
ncbi:MAG: hypothetical protein WKF43_08560 [Acidimicrobiales bacterium]